MRRDLRYRNFQKYKKYSRKNNVRRQFYIAVILFVLCVLLAILTIIFALTGVFEKNNNSSSVSEKHGNNMTEVNIEPIAINENTKIRVLIKTGGFDDIFHNDVQVSSDIGFVVSADASLNLDSVNIAPGESIKMSELAQFFENNCKVHINAVEDNAALYLDSVERSCGKPAYYGEFDIYKNDNGYVIINDVLLDKYLYGVVPSEMPESYGMEALKAQAVCARSYAARRINALAYPEYEAAVDDSVRYQVYNNYEVTEAVKEAVDATSGELAKYGGEIIDAYFYATSCGSTAGGEVWSDESGNCPYLKCRELNESNCSVDLSSEESFKNYIDNSDSNNFDSSAAWYRWEIKLDLSKLSDEFVEEYGNFKEIKVLKRSSGGVITNLSFICEKKELNLEKEYDIREFLGKLIAGGNNQSNEIGSKITMLPSACFYAADCSENIITVKGGGYGHGVGMSQTGAKGMAEAGYDYKKILSCFYPDIIVEKML